MPKQSQPPIESIEHTLRWLVITTISLWICGLIIAGYVYLESQHTRDEGHITHAALCTFRGGLEDQIDTSLAFLVLHPNGIFGIPPTTILEGIHKQKIAVHSLSNLSC